MYTQRKSNNISSTFIFTTSIYLRSGHFLKVAIIVDFLPPPLLPDSVTHDSYAKMVVSKTICFVVFQDAIEIFYCNLIENTCTQEKQFDFIVRLEYAIR